MIPMENYETKYRILRAKVAKAIDFFEKKAQLNDRAANEEFHNGNKKYAGELNYHAGGLREAEEYLKKLL